MTLLELVELLRKHLKLVIAMPVACAAIMAGVSFTVLPDTYTAATSMYVLASEAQTDYSSLSSDLSASQMVANDVATLLSSDRTLNETAEDLGLEDLDAYGISVSSETTSRVITLYVTGADPSEAAAVANTMAENVSAIAQEVMNVDSVNVIDEAQTPDEPSGPNRPLYIAVALFAGLFLAVAVVVVADMLNTKVRGQRDVEELLDIPVIGRVPALKGGI